MIKGINHITLSVKDLEESFRFYQDVLGFVPVLKWAKGAYFQAGELWFCLFLDPKTRTQPNTEYTHLAFDVARAHFNVFAERLSKTTVWQDNSSEGESIYFLDPDGHKLEIHSGTLGTRLASAKKNPWGKMEIFATGEALKEPKWLEWAKRIQAIAQTGEKYTKDLFDRDRYGQLTEIAAEIVAQYADEPMPRIHKLFSDQKGYATPKIDVRGAVFQENRILLAKERSDGLWTLPGGWADINQSASESVIREVKEETGFETRVIKLAALLDKRKQGHPPELFHTYKAFFLCELLGGTATPSLETSEVGFFERQNIPELSLHRVTAAQIERMFRHLENPTFQTDFD
jgi:ADP-ribose pyrophosphatase YjhB (NUDIX family)/catechol 2,3-dioxygenase-like lactoylglutathione lyase family enzyme